MSFLLFYLSDSKINTTNKIGASRGTLLTTVSG